MEEVKLEGIMLKAYDLGGMAQQRRIWKDYFPLIDAIVFVVDATDTKRFPDAANELQTLLSIQEIQTKPVLVLGNKIDQIGAVSHDELRIALGLGMTVPNPPVRCDGCVGTQLH